MCVDPEVSPTISLAGRIFFRGEHMDEAYYKVFLRTKTFVTKCCWKQSLGGNYLAKGYLEPSLGGSFSNERILQTFLRL